METKHIKKRLNNQLQYIENNFENCGLPDYIMAVVWSNLLILDELKKIKLTKD